MEFIDRDIECSDCGNIVEAEAKYCNNCGKELKLESTCKSCGSSLDPEDSFCSNCGAEVTEEQSTDEQSDINQENIEMYADEIKSEIDNAIDKAVLVELQKEKFIGIYISDYDVPWEYCPNCGFHRGVLSEAGQAICLLCRAEWINRGILNSRWEVVSASNIRVDIDGSEVDWKRSGRDRAQKELYKQKIPDVDQVVER